MKLTKYQKEGIVRAVMADVPSPVESLVKAQIQEALLAAMSPEAKALYSTCPKALRTTRVQNDITGVGYGFDAVCGDVSDVNKVLASFAEKESARRSARSQLAGAVMSCSTLKQLETLLPEFKKYYPTEACPTKNLPALANVVSDLVRIGWPKGATA